MASLKLFIILLSLADANSDEVLTRGVQVQAANQESCLNIGGGVAKLIEQERAKNHMPKMIITWQCFEQKNQSKI